MPSKPNYPIGSVESALKLLLLLRDHPRLRVKDVAQHLGVAQSTAHRLLAMLVAQDFVSRDPTTRMYSAGNSLLTLGLAAVRNYDLRRQMRPHLERLSETIDETVHLVILNGAESFFVDGVECDQAVRVGSRIGIALPAHATSGGKALLAELSNDELRGLYPRQRLRIFSPNTVEMRSDLEVELSEIRESGYAISLGETGEQVGAVAAVVRGSSGTLFAAVAIAAPIYRAHRDKLQELAVPLLATCATAGEQLP